jgi:hypothetical protein
VIRIPLRKATARVRQHTTTCLKHDDSLPSSYSRNLLSDGEIDFRSIHLTSTRYPSIDRLLYREKLHLFTAVAPVGIVAIVQSQPFRRDQGAFLFDVMVKGFSKGEVQEVSGGVVVAGPSSMIL